MPQLHKSLNFDIYIAEKTLSITGVRQPRMGYNNLITSPI